MESNIQICFHYSTLRYLLQIFYHIFMNIVRSIWHCNYVKVHLVWNGQYENSWNHFIYSTDKAIVFNGKITRLFCYGHTNIIYTLNSSRSSIPIWVCPYWVETSALCAISKSNWSHQGQREASVLIVRLKAIYIRRLQTYIV